VKDLAPGATNSAMLGNNKAAGELFANSNAFVREQVSYHVAVSHNYIVQNMRVASVRAARRKLVKLFKKSNSKFYWYDFTVRGCRYRGSTQETKSVRALQIASLRLASAMENTDPLPSKPPVLGELAGRFLD
jgi:hypothetical protein